MKPLPSRAALLALPVCALLGCAGSTAEHPPKSAMQRMPPATIQRIVRAKYAGFRACYEAGLRRDPTIHGHLSPRFVITHDGTVSQVTMAGSDIADEKLERCVIDIVEKLRFPPVDVGVITVVYPLRFEPNPPPATAAPPTP